MARNAAQEHIPDIIGDDGVAFAVAVTSQQSVLARRFVLTAIAIHGSDAELDGVIAQVRLYLFAPHALGGKHELQLVIYTTALPPRRCEILF